MTAQPSTIVQQELIRNGSAQWGMSFPFQPYNGGQGVSLACTTSSGRIQLIGSFGVAEEVSVAVIVNTGAVWANVRIGDATVTADTGCMGVPPGGAITVVLPGATDTSSLYIAGITATSTATIQITTGFGN